MWWFHVLALPRNFYILKVATSHFQLLPFNNLIFVFGWSSVDLRSLFHRNCERTPSFSHLNHDLSVTSSLREVEENSILLGLWVLSHLGWAPLSVAVLSGFLFNFLKRLVAQSWEDQKFDLRVVRGQEHCETKRGPDHTCKRGAAIPHLQTWRAATSVKLATFGLSFNMVQLHTYGVERGCLRLQVGCSPHHTCGVDHVWYYSEFNVDCWPSRYFILKHSLQSGFSKANHFSRLDRTYASFSKEWPEWVTWM